MRLHCRLLGTVHLPRSSGGRALYVMVCAREMEQALACWQIMAQARATHLSWATHQSCHRCMQHASWQWCDRQVMYRGHQQCVAGPAPPAVAVSCCRALHWVALYGPTCRLAECTGAACVIGAAFTGAVALCTYPISCVCVYSDRIVVETLGLKWTGGDETVCATCCALQDLGVLLQGVIYILAHEFRSGLNYLPLSPSKEAGIF